MPRRIPGAILGLALLAACNRDAMLLKVASPEADAFARAQIVSLAKKAPEDVISVLAPRLTQLPAIRDSIAQVQRYFRDIGSVEKVQVIAAQTFDPFESDLMRRSLLYQVLGSRGDLLVEFQLLEEFGEHYIDALQVHPITPAMRAQFGFWRSIGVGQLLALTCMVASVGFMFWTAVVVARTPMRRRWLWAVVALIGVTKLTMNWTTGVVTYQLLTVQLLGAALGKPVLLGPWWVAFTFPAGALLALHQRKRALNQVAPIAVAPHVESGSASQPS